MNCYLKIYLAPNNFTVNPPHKENETVAPIPFDKSNYSNKHEELLIWEGYFNTNTMDKIEFDKELSGRYLRLLFINNSLKWKDGNDGRTDISSFELGYTIYNKKIYPMTNRRYISLANRWDEYRGGAYYNGKGFTGYAKDAAPKSTSSSEGKNDKNSVMTIRIPKLKPEFGIIGDYYPTMGTAIVKIDNKEVGKIGPEETFDIVDDKRKLKKASRSYKSILFYTNKLDKNKQHTCTVEVTKGQITFSALLTHQMVVRYDTDDYRYPRIIATEFDENPEQYDWDMPTKEFLEQQNAKYYYYKF